MNARAPHHWATVGISNGRLLILMIAFLVVGGLSSLSVLPRMEDPVLTPRAATITTLYPVADAEQVESLVTDRIEQSVREVEAIKEMRSESRSGVSLITIELRDDVYNTGPIWSRIRGKVEDSISLLPPEASRPQFEDIDVRAFAWIGGLVWKSKRAPNYAILGRFAKDLEDRLRSVGGTDDVEQFGRPDEEIVVSVDPAELAQIGLSTADVANVIGNNDTRNAAGSVRSIEESLPIELTNQLASLSSIQQLPLKNDSQGRFAVLGDVATVDRVIADPPSQIGQIDGCNALLVAAMVRQTSRIDQWRSELEVVIEEFKTTLPPIIELETVLDQNNYVQGRLGELIANLLIGSLAVMVVVWILMGWRNALMVSTALPLVSMAVLSGMRFMSVPIHQMSVAGLIIALGLLIDNAIVIVDSVSSQLASGKSKLDAVSTTGKILFIPLLASTLTTAFAFAPICLMEGPAGEFVGAMASNVILAISSSLFISLLIIAPLATILHKGSSQNNSAETNGAASGLSAAWVKPTFRRFLRSVVVYPKISMSVCAAAAMLGFFCLGQLPDQFFPPADRDQFHIELELPQNASFAELEELTARITDQLSAHPRVEQTTWLLGRSAPTFYYNIITRRQNAKEYAQAIVQLDSNEGSVEVIQSLQTQLQNSFPEARVLARQLEQGPPFAAPIEVRFFGPDLDKLRQLGGETRKLLSELPHVVHTRVELNDSTPTIAIQVEADQARLAGFTPSDIARQLNSQMEGTLGGFVLQSTEQIPVRVRTNEKRRRSLIDLQSIDLVRTAGTSIAASSTSASSTNGSSANGSSANGSSASGSSASGTSADGTSALVPLSAVATLGLKPKPATVSRLNSIRVQEVQAFLSAGTLPSTVLSQLNERFAEGAIEIPPGYRMSFGGEASKRNEAVGNLMASVGVLVAAIVMTLVLSIGSFRSAAVIGAVAMMAIGFGGISLYLFGYPFGFMAIVGIMGLLGVAINDSIVVLTALRHDAQASQGNIEAILDVTLHETRHVLATTFTTIAGFVPLILSGGGFWPPMAIAIAGGVVGCTVLALLFVPAAFGLMVKANAS